MSYIFKIGNIRINPLVKIGYYLYISNFLKINTYYCIIPFIKGLLDNLQKLLITKIL